MASDYGAINTAHSKSLTARAAALGVFSHPNGKGDGREDLLRDFLLERLGTSFGVAKCEIIDSAGASSLEHDITIFDHGVLASLSVSSERRIVRVESVALVIEVKSRLVPASADDERERLERLGKLRRWYTPAPLLRVLMANAERVGEEARALLTNGLGAREGREEIPAIVPAYFAYDGPDSAEALEDFATKAGLDIVCVLGKATVFRPLAGENRVFTRWGFGDDALGAFVDCVRLALENFRASRSLVTPGGAYHQPSTAMG